MLLLFIHDGFISIVLRFELILLRLLILEAGLGTSCWSHHGGLGGSKPSVLALTALRNNVLNHDSAQIFEHRVIFTGTSAEPCLLHFSNWAGSGPGSVQVHVTLKLLVHGWSCRKRQKQRNERKENNGRKSRKKLKPVSHLIRASQSQRSNQTFLNPPLANSLTNQTPALHPLPPTHTQIIYC